ncbi:MAG TPA: protein kinase [Thermoanaerobaculia bacterium]|nr:protein kinase [Thermoanaerobaculia bacterium]
MHIGETVSHYRIVGKLGEGGMGVVYHAEDVRLGRPVALKVLAPQLAADAVARRRFADEARAASALDHPNICAIYDVGEADGGRLFLALAFCEGETLRAALDRRPIEPPRALTIAAQVADGLAEAHAKSILHRDIKPANLMLRPDGLVKILDFGVAKLERDAGITGPTDSIGSPAYMAPEQIRSGRVGPGVDLWSLGVVLFEMITGQRPFAGDVHTVLDGILHREPPPLDALRPGVHPEISRIVARSLAKDPAVRYGSARELAADLRATESESAEPTRIVDSRSAPAGATSSQARSQPQTQGGAYGSGGPRAQDGQEPQASLAVLPFADLSPARDQDWFCEGLAEELITALAEVRGLRVASRASTFQFSGEDPRVIGEKLRVETLLTGSVRSAGKLLRITTQLVRVEDGSVLASSRYDREMEDIFAIQEAIAGSVVEIVKARFGEHITPPQVRRPTESVEAYNLYLKGRYHWNRRTPDGFRNAIRFFEQAIAIDPGFALGYVGQADSHAMLGFFGLAPPRAVVVKGKELCLRALELDPTLPEARTALALLHGLYEWQWERSEAELRAVLDAHPGHAMARHALAIYVLVPLGRFDEALVEMRAALAIEPLSLPFNVNLGFILYMARRYVEAERQLLTTLELDPAYPLALLALGETIAQVGRVDQAIDLMRKPTDSIENRGFLGAHLARAGLVSEARAVLAELSDPGPGGYMSPIFAAQVHLHLGETERALDLLERALEEGAPRLVWIGVRPSFDPLRDHPRFQRILDRMRLPNLGPEHAGSS